MRIGASLSPPLVSPCVKRRSRWPSAPGALILSEVGLNVTVRRRPRLLIQAYSTSNIARSSSKLGQACATTSAAECLPPARLVVEPRPDLDHVLADCHSPFRTSACSPVAAMENL